MWGSGAVYHRKSDNRWIARLEVHDGRPKAVVSRAPALGGYALDALRPAHVQAFLNAQRRRYSPRTVAHQLACLRTALQSAVREGSVTRNVGSLVRGPHIPHSEVRPLSQAEAAQFLAHVRGDSSEALYVLALHTGMRQGELLGLRWEDVDLPGAQLHVRKALVVGGRYLDDVKTERSRRTVDLSPAVVASLREHLRRQMVERENNPKRKEQGFVFAGPLGSPLEATSVTRRFQSLLAEAGLPRQRFHDLRHAAASIMLANGVLMRQVADILGHSTPTVTANVYSHLGSDAGKDVAERMERALG